MYQNMCSVKSTTLSEASAYSRRATSPAAARRPGAAVRWGIAFAIVSNHELHINILVRLTASPASVLVASPLPSPPSPPLEVSEAPSVVVLSPPSSLESPEVEAD